MGTIVFIALHIVALLSFAPITSMAAAPKTPWVSPDSDDVVAESLAKAIYSQAKDPTSVRFLSLGTPDGEAWCVVYSATNSFNARITEQMYFNNRTTRASKVASEFNRHCAGALRKDYSEAMNAAILAVRKKLGLP